MSTASTITGIVPGVMATSLLAHNVGEIDFDVKPKKGKKKRNHAKKMVKLGMANLVGIGMIRATAQQASLVP